MIIEVINLLGDKIKKLRESERLTQKQLADIIGVGQSTIGMIESGKNKGSNETLFKLSKHFNVSLDYLLNAEEKPKHQLPSSGNTIYLNEENHEKYSTKEPIDKISKIASENKIQTLAAHFKGEEFTDEDVEDIENFIKFILSKKKK